MTSSTTVLVDMNFEHQFTWQASKRNPHLLGSIPVDIPQATGQQHSAVREKRTHKIPRQAAVMVHQVHHSTPPTLGPPYIFRNPSNSRFPAFRRRGKFAKSAARVPHFGCEVRVLPLMTSANFQNFYYSPIVCVFSQPPLTGLPYFFCM